jgi:hypothetical protein
MEHLCIYRDLARKSQLHVLSGLELRVVHIGNIKPGAGGINQFKANNSELNRQLLFKCGVGWVALNRGPGGKGGGPGR